MNLFNRLLLSEELNLLQKKSIPFFLLKGGRIVSVFLNPQFFNPQTTILSSKKDTMQKLHSKQQAIKTKLGADPELLRQFYHVTGIIVRVKRASLNSSLILRNVVARFPFEFLYPFFAPILWRIFVVRDMKKKYSRSRLFYLRNKKARLSKWPSTFVMEQLPLRVKNVYGVLVYQK